MLFQTYMVCMGILGSRAEPASTLTQGGRTRVDFDTGWRGAWFPRPALEAQSGRRPSFRQLCALPGPSTRDAVSGDTQHFARRRRQQGYDVPNPPTSSLDVRVWLKLFHSPHGVDFPQKVETPLIRSPES